MATKKKTTRTTAARRTKSSPFYAKRLIVPAEVIILALILALVSVRHWAWHWAWGIGVFVLVAALSVAFYTVFRPFRWAFVLSFSVLWAYIAGAAASMIYTPITGFWRFLIAAVVFVLSFRLHVWEWYKMQD